jgi:hypothetical protein
MQTMLSGQAIARGDALLLKFVDSLTIRVLLEKKLANVVVVVDNCILDKNISNYRKTIGRKGVSIRGVLSFQLRWPHRGVRLLCLQIAS